MSVPPLGERVAALEVQVKTLSDDAKDTDKIVTSLREFQIVLMAGATIVGTILGLLIQFAPAIWGKLLT
jgi:hypothetical protein